MSIGDLIFSSKLNKQHPEESKMSAGRTVLDCLMHKLPSSRKFYRVTLIVPDNGIPMIEYKHASSPNKPKKLIQFVDLLFADKKHDTNEKFAFSIYTIDKTTTFMTQDETTMNEWLSKIREFHSNLYPEFKGYDVIFEASLLDKGLAKTMNIRGPYRLALCKESLDLIPLLKTNQSSASSLQQQPKQQELPSHKQATHPQVPQHTIVTSSANTNPIHHHLPQHLPSHQRFHKRHPLLSSKTIELVHRSIRRCGHTDRNFYIESGRYSQIGEGDLWLALNKKSTARQLHELLLAAMQLAPNNEDQLIYKAPRSRSGSSTANTISSLPMFSSKSNDIDEDSGYLPMA